jgi:hypothetical protein
VLGTSSDLITCSREFFDQVIRTYDSAKHSSPALIDLELALYSFPKQKTFTFHLPPNLKIVMAESFDITIDSINQGDRVSEESDEVILAAARKLFEEGI